MKTAIAGLTALCSVGCLLIASQADARSIRTDSNPGNDGWSTCGDGTTCSSLPVAVNPLGSLPSAAPAAFMSLGGDATFVTGDLDLQTSTGYMGTAPGLSLLYGTTSNLTAQVLYFNLSNVGPVAAYNSSGQIVTLGTPNAGTNDWEIELNYNSKPTSSASIEIGGDIFTAPPSVLAPNSANDNLNEFVYFDGKIYAPPGWSPASATTAAPEIDSSSAIGALTLLAGCLVILRPRRTPLRTAA
jgi:hypothetical protein